LNYNVGVTYNLDTEISILFDLNIRENIKGSYLALNIYDNDDQLVYWAADYESDRFKSEILGRISVKCVLPKYLLTTGDYKLNFAIYSPIKGVVHFEESRTINFKVEDDTNSFLNQFNISYPGKTAIPSNWYLIKNL
jgi:hypothetical protein